MIERFLLTGTIVQLLLQLIRGQTSSQRYVALKVGQAFETKVTGVLSDHTAHLLTGGWFKATGVDYQCVSAKDSSRDVHDNSEDYPGRYRSERLKLYDRVNLCHPTNVWMFLTWRYLLAWSSTLQAFEDSSAKYLLIMPRGASTTSSTSIKMISLASAGGYSVYYPYDAQISSAKLFYLVHYNSTSHYEEAFHELKIGPLKYNPLNHLQMNKLFVLPSGSSSTSIALDTATILQRITTTGFTMNKDDTITLKNFLTKEHFTAVDTHDSCVDLKHTFTFYNSISKVCKDEMKLRINFDGTTDYLIDELKVKPENKFDAVEGIITEIKFKAYSGAGDIKKPWTPPTLQRIKKIVSQVKMCYLYGEMYFRHSIYNLHQRSISDRACLHC